jgi:topoisomerase-4 subunit A
MPAAFPNLLANGSSGIAVGMATNIPPHNLDELISGCHALLKDPETSDEAWSRLIPGPDFPTGGVIVEPRDSILEAYRTGRGSRSAPARSGRSRIWVAAPGRSSSPKFPIRCRSPS